MKIIPTLETGVASDDTGGVNGLVYNFYEADGFYESAVIDDSRLMLPVLNVFPLRGTRNISKTDKNNMIGKFYGIFDIGAHARIFGIYIAQKNIPDCSS